MVVLCHADNQTKPGAGSAAPVAVGSSAIQRKCDSCAENEVQLKSVGMGLPYHILQKQDEDDIPSPDSTPDEEIDLFPPSVFHFPPLGGGFSPSLPELLAPGLSIDWFSMSRPYYDRGVPHLRFGDHDAIQQRWLDTFSLARQLGFNPDRSSWISNQLTPMAIDAALVNDYPTTFELMNREMNVSPIMLNAPAIHFKLNVGGANDSYEQEADHIAEQVMRMAEPGLQRKCTECEEEEIRAKPMPFAASPKVQQKGGNQIQRNEDEPGQDTRPVYMCSKDLDTSPIGKHAFFRVGGTGSGNPTFSLQPIDASLGADCWQGVPGRDYPSDFNARGDCEQVPITPAQLESEHRAYPVGHYCTLGPNSNTYVGHIARNCGIANPDPPGWTPGIDESPPPEGTFAPDKWDTLTGCTTKICLFEPENRPNPIG
jgi:hypothetical protein